MALGSSRSCQEALGGAEWSEMVRNGQCWSEMVIVMGVFVIKKSKKIEFFDPLYKKNFKISTDSKSPSEAEPSCAFSSKLVKKMTKLISKKPPNTN